MRFDFFMIKRTVDNRQAFVHKESLTVSLWFCMLVLQFTSRTWKNYFLKTIYCFRRKCRPYVSGFCNIFTLTC